MINANTSLEQLAIEIEILFMEQRNKIGKKQTPSDCPLVKRLENIPPPTIFNGENTYR